MKLPSLHTLAFVVALLLGAVAAARAQTGTPQSPYVITSVPYVVNAPGYYILGKNLPSTQTSGNLVEVRANNVTLDFNGFYVAGPANNTGQRTIGVFAAEQSNLTVKNGTVAYCFDGILISGNNQANTNVVGAIVDNMRVTYCYNSGIAVSYCPASRIQNCLVSQTGYSGTNTATAIYGNQAGVTVQNNVVSTVTAINGVGVFAYGGFARQNTISNASYGVYGGTYQDNLTTGCTTPFGNGIDAGGNK